MVESVKFHCGAHVGGGQGMLVFVRQEPAGCAAAKGRESSSETIRAALEAGMRD